MVIVCLAVCSFLFPHIPGRGTRVCDTLMIKHSVRLYIQLWEVQDPV